MQLAKRLTPDPIIPYERELRFLNRALEIKDKIQERGESLITILRRPIAIHIRAFKIAIQDRHIERQKQQNELKKQIIARLKRETNQS